MTAKNKKTIKLLSISISSTLDTQIEKRIEKYIRRIFNTDERRLFDITTLSESLNFLQCERDFIYKSEQPFVFLRNFHCISFEDMDIETYELILKNTILAFAIGLKIDCKVKYSFTQQ